MELMGEKGRGEERKQISVVGVFICVRRRVAGGDCPGGAEAATFPFTSLFSPSKMTKAANNLLINENLQSRFPSTRCQNKRDPCTCGGGVDKREQPPRKPIGQPSGGSSRVD